LEVDQNDVNKAHSNGWSPLNLAVDNNNIEIVTLLLNVDQIDVNTVTNDGWCSLNLAVDNNNI